MKRIGTFLFAGLLAITSACSTKVPPGYVGVLVSTTGTQKEAKDFPIKRGRVFYNPLTEDVYSFPTFVQNITWTHSKDEGHAVDESITFNSIEGASINADIALAYSFVPEKVPAIFVRFRQDAQTITEGYMRNKVRAAFNAEASKDSVQNIYGAGKQAFVVAVKKRLNDDLGPEGFQFDMVDLIGKPRLPENVQAAINNSLEATQKAQTAENELKITQAEAAKTVAEAEGDAKALLVSANARAKSNAILEAALTPAILRKQAIEKWDGHFPQVMGQNNSMMQLILGGAAEKPEK